MERVRYRARQFWRAISDRSTPEGLAQAKEFLPPQLYPLFEQMQPFEQAHALRVLASLQSQRHTHPDLLAAALLHDCGKALCPLAPWERALAVLGKKVLPRLATRWGAGDAKGWRRGFVVAAQHPRWGAELAARAGASPNLVKLIAQHQTDSPSSLDEEEAAMLSALQAVDEKD